jgi:hypothetical protein
VTAADKPYDATTAAALTSCTVSGVIGGQLVGCTGTATFGSAQAGTGKTVTATGLSLTGAAAINYVLSTTTATTTASITPLTVTPDVTAADKPYEGTTAATLTSCTVDGVLSGEVVGCTGAATFESANAGANQTVIASGLTLTGGAAAGNYVLGTTTAATTASITALPVTPAVTAADKPYDGTAAAILTSCTVDGVVSGDVVACAGTATFADANVGTGKTVTANGLSLTGAAAGNYVLTTTTATTTAAVTALAVTPLVTAADKPYDGTNGATLTSCTVAGALGGDMVACSGTATFADSNVGTGKTVLVTGLTLTGAGAGNYVLSPTTATTAASITQLPVSAQVTVADKTYDGTVTATITSCTVNGVVGEESVGCTGTAQFASPNVGAQTVNVTGLTLTGPTAGNYTLTATSVVTAATIHPNLAPVVTNPGSQLGFQGVSVTLAMAGTDGNGDSLTWSAQNLPAGLSIDPSTGIISGTPTAMGTFPVVITAADQTANGQASFTWSIGSPVPDAVQLISPSGSIPTSIPLFVWTADPRATYYLLSVTDGAEAAPTQMWYTPGQAACAAGTGSCTVPSPRTLAAGLVQWQVLTWSSFGTGPWSSTMSFVVNLAAPSVPAPVTSGPSGAIGTRTPTYVWQPVAQAIWYQLAITDALGVNREFWYTPQNACPGASCSVTPNLLLPVGQSQWRVRAWTTLGAGAWSAWTTFTAADSTPGGATLISPSGATTTTPTFTWSAVPGATYYLLRVVDRNNVTSDVWYGAAAVGCPSGSGTCAITPGTALPPGPAEWMVLAWNASGYGPWSDPMQFWIDVVDGSAPTPTLVSPLTSISTPTATYRWTSASGTLFYRLSIRNNGGAAQLWWLTPANVGCVTGAQCQATPSISLQHGTAEWQVQVWRANGHGPWSAPTTISVNIEEPLSLEPPAPTLIAPIGSTTASPTYTWNASARATLYYVSVYDVSGLRVDRWLLPTEVGCEAGSGVCTFNPGVTLTSGAGSWQVIAWNSAGYSPWSSTFAFIVP